MAEQLASVHYPEIDFDSAGVSDEEHGNPMDSRAVRTLQAHGYQPGSHAAKQVTKQLIAEADLVLGFTQDHVNRMQLLAPDAQNIRLMTDFDPAAAPGTPMPDPWYGGMEDFEDTYQSIMACLPGIAQYFE